jgi:murein L,D-transpeptidase YafK
MVRSLVAFLALVGGGAVGLAGSAREFSSSALEAQQARYGRVQEARRRQGRAVDTLFAHAGLEYPAAVMLRAFKQEEELELWAGPAVAGRWVRVARYPIAAASGDLGPKRRRWDRQVPEGFYRVDGFNGASRYHLSLHVDDPNASDRILGNRRHPGNNIFIHGDEVSSGCIAVGDRAIEQLYLIALDSTAAGHAVQVQIYPCRFSSPACARRLAALSRRTPRLAEFWANLREGFDAFQRSGAPPAVTVDASGRYLFAASPQPESGTSRYQVPKEEDRVPR